MKTRSSTDAGMSCAAAGGAAQRARPRTIAALWPHAPRVRKITAPSPDTPGVYDEVAVDNTARRRNPSARGRGAADGDSAKIRSRSALAQATADTLDSWLSHGNRG